MKNQEMLKEVAKMRSLMERIENPHTGRQAMLNEEKHLNEAVERKVQSPNEIFDILNKIGKNDYVCVGYVTGANLNLPKVKRLNPETNRMKGYDDYETFGKEVGVEGEIGALVNITSYNFRYYNVKDMDTKYYNEYKPKFNDIRTEFGLEPSGEKAGYTTRIDYGDGIVAYDGEDERKQGNWYLPSNVHGVHPRSVTYVVDKEGHIIQELSKEQIKPYLKAAGEEVSGANALRKMGVEEERVKEYIDKVRSLKMSYKRFEGNSILWVVATVNGQKIVYINTNLKRSVGDVNVNPSDFVAKAMERYKVDVNSMPQA